MSKKPKSKPAPLLAEKLISIRESRNMSVAELREISDVPANTIYTAEGRDSMTGRKITSGMLRQIYHPFCETEDEWIELLLLWAMDRDDYRVTPDDLRRVGEEMADKHQSAEAIETAVVSAHLAAMKAAKKKTVITLLEHLAKHDDFMPVIESWLAMAKK